MSINYHAYQNRGFKLSTFKEIEKQWVDRFTGFNPERIAAILDLEHDKDFLYIRYYNKEFRLRLDIGRIEKKTDDPYDCIFMPDEIPLEEGWHGDVYTNEAMAIYHILYYTVDNPILTGEWINNKALDPRHVRHKNEDVLFDDFASHFQGDTNKLKEACEAFGGTPIVSKADAAYQFYPFPQIPIQIIYWEADEDFPAQVQALVDKNITDYVHIETTGCLVSDLFERIINLKPNANV